MDRTQKIIRTSILGIIVNLVLVAFKAAVGLISGSIAVILDAVNNLSDALSSVITIIGTRLAGRAPDKKHPYGHGRIEYLTGVLIAVIVLFAGISSLRESVLKIIHPEAAEYSVTSLIIIVAAIIAKFLMGRYVKHVGEQINASTLVASGSDALFDAVLSAGTLAAAIISLVWNISLEGVFGAIISLFILKAGIEMLSDTLNTIIGTRAEKELTEALRAKVNSYPQVLGAYDLTLHNYGPYEVFGTVHIEVADDTTARALHQLTHQISADVFAEFGIILTVGIYAANDDAGIAADIKQNVERIAAQYPQVLQVHGLYLDEVKKAVSFDLVLDFDADRQAVQQQILQQISALYPDYQFTIVLDSDYSD